MRHGIPADELFAEIEADSEYQEAVRKADVAFGLARNVLRLRVQNGWSQQELARRAGMRQPRIAEIEGAKGNPRLDTLTRIAGALGVTLEDLFCNVVEEPGNITRVHLVIDHHAGVGAVSRIFDTPALAMEA